MEEIRNIFLIFMIYSLIGWTLEIIEVGLLSKKIVNRGFLIGPYCPIYGFGALFLTIFLKGTNTDLFGVFTKSLIICSILEYVTSYIMEKLFKTRWWDYSENKFNINGRICLEGMILFGVGGCLIMEYSNPFLFSVINDSNAILLNIISIILAIVFLIDLIISFKIISKLETKTKIYKDSTEEIKEKVKSALINNYLSNRLIKAFPNVKKYLFKTK